jgi:hypothetical protein
MIHLTTVNRFILPFSALPLRAWKASQWTCPFSLLGRPEFDDILNIVL